VVGVLTVQRGGFTQDDVIYIPLKAAQVRLKDTATVDQIMVRADTIANVDRVAQDITTTLRQNHHLGKSRANNFHIETFTQFLQRAGQGDQVLTFLLVGIAAISLTVGGIGIMNIMLVSVTERTWEIGIRMSLGARRRDIRNQFLIEALMLCLVGGVIGLLLGLLIGWALTNGFGLPFVVNAITLALPFAVSAAIALAFGIYPAIQASRLDPIVAIRSEE
jgi:putative ABC transport system permease protein